MKMNKNHLFAALLVLSFLTAGVTTVKAASTSRMGGPNPFGNIVEAIAEKFDLEESEVEAVIDEVMEAHKKEMREKMEEDVSARLKEAVANGTITQSQADLVQAKHIEIKADQSQKLENRPGYKTMTSAEREERMEEMKAQREELLEWAEDNDIPKEYLFFTFGGKNVKFHKDSMRMIDDRDEVVNSLKVR
jgi:hypothetical protein